MKICLFLFIFSLYFTINCLFFRDSTMHEIYVNIGNFIYQIRNLINLLKVKFALFLLLIFFLLLLFWYYLSWFCTVYKNTQIHLTKDTLISFGLSLLYPLLLYLIPDLFRIPSIRTKRGNRTCLYKISKVFQLI